MPRRLRRRLHRHLLHRRGAQRLALRHRLALSLGHVAVRLLSGNRPAPDLPPSADRSAHLPPRSEGQHARRERIAARQRHFHALQNTFKILINSFYGYLGFAQGHFADFEAAARVTQIGRDLLKQMIDWLKAARRAGHRSRHRWHLFRPAAES